MTRAIIPGIIADIIAVKKTVVHGEKPFIQFLLSVKYTTVRCSLSRDFGRFKIKYEKTKNNPLPGGTVSPKGSGAMFS